MYKYNDLSVSSDIIEVDGRKYPLFSPEGFKILSDLWLKVGWDQKHLYSFTWMGRPMIQNPEDMIRMQEVIWQTKPDVIIETGIAHGGSLVFYASLLESLGKGKIIGVDVEIRHHNRKALEDHELFKRICLVEGSSTCDRTVREVSKTISKKDKVLVILDSAHDYDHVLMELKLYSEFVTKESYIVVTDGSQEFLGNTPRAKKDYGDYAETWEDNNPKKASATFLKNNKIFKLVEPNFAFNEGSINFRISHWPDAFLQKIAE